MGERRLPATDRRGETGCREAWLDGWLRSRHFFALVWLRLGKLLRWRYRAITRWWLPGGLGWKSARSAGTFSGGLIPIRCLRQDWGAYTG
jgi:hypothetical protein